MANPEAIAADILWVPVNAMLQPDAARPVMVKNGRSIYVDGSGAVGFVLTADREVLTSQIVQHFEEAEWRQRRTQDLNPQLATSFESGWQSRCACVIRTDPQGNRIPSEPFHQWHGEWENVRGDLLTYYLSAEGQQVRGYAEFMPVSVVDERRRKLGR